MSKILLLSATKYEHGLDSLFDIPIYTIGIGKINASVNTANLIKEINPDFVINFGSCGNLKNYKVGEVLEVGEVVDDLDTQGYYIPPNLKLNSASDIKCLTTDHMYDSSHTNYIDSYLKLIKECDIVDMELFGIAKACYIANKPLYSFKWVSDDGSNDDWLKNARAGFENFKILFDNIFL